MEWGVWNTLIQDRLPIAALKTAELIYQPTFLEILPMYSLFMLTVPIIINHLERRKHLEVATISVLFWASDQFGARIIIQQFIFSHHDVYFGVFSSVAWQILFVAGLMCGHKTYITNAQWVPKGWKFALIAYIFAVMFFLLRHAMLGMSFDSNWTQRSSLGFIRLLNVGALLFLFVCFREKIETIIAYKGLAFLSKHSLQVFSFHLLPVYCVSYFIVGSVCLSWVTQWIIILYCIAGIFVIAYIAELIKRIAQLEIRWRC